MRTFCGSPYYAAPELLEGVAYHGPAVDVWALGVILYTMTTSCLPFSARNLLELAGLVARCQFVVPEYLSPGGALANWSQPGTHSNPVFRRRGEESAVDARTPQTCRRSSGQCWSLIRLAVRHWTCTWTSRGSMSAGRPKRVSCASACHPPRFLAGARPNGLLCGTPLVRTRGQHRAILGVTRLTPYLVFHASGGVNRARNHAAQVSATVGTTNGHIQ